MIIRLFITTIFLCVSSNCEEMFRVIENQNKVKNIYYGKTKITDFKNPHHIYSFTESLDKKLFLVHHMDFKPTKVSIYNLETKTKLTSFEPGVNGIFTFGVKNRIILTYGFGTGRYVRVLNLQGKDLYDGKKSSLYEKSDIIINETKTLIYRLPNVDGQKIFEVINIETGETKVFDITLKEKLEEEKIIWEKP